MLAAPKLGKEKAGVDWAPKGCPKRDVLVVPKMEGLACEVDAPKPNAGVLPNVDAVKEPTVSTTSV